MTVLCGHATRTDECPLSEEKRASTWYGSRVSGGVLLADRAAKLICELGSYSGISEAPSNVVTSIFATAAPALRLYAVASMKLMHSGQFPVKAFVRHEQFHNVRISSLGIFGSRAIFCGHCS